MNGASDKSWVFVGEGSQLQKHIREGIEVLGSLVSVVQS